MKTLRKSILVHFLLLATVLTNLATSIPVLAGSINNAIGLIEAAKRGDATEVKRFIDGGTDVNAIKNKNEAWTALHYASHRGHTEVVKVLLENGANIDLKDKLDGGTTALIFAANQGHAKVAKLLIDNGANVNIKRNKDGMTALMQAAEHNHIETVRVILESDADVNIKDNRKGWFALLYAANKGNSEIVKLLIDKGADVDLKSFSGMTALSYAIKKNHIETVKVLLDKGANYNIRDLKHGGNSVIHAAAKGNTLIVGLLLNKGADVDFMDVKGHTPLTHALMYEHFETAKVLLESGADVNAKNNEGWTALHYVSHRGNIDGLELLLAHGADVNVINDKKNTPLYYAAREGKTEAVRILLEKGADFNAKGYKGRTPLDMAEEERHIETARVLRRAMGLPEPSDYNEPEVEAKNFSLKIKLTDEGVSDEINKEREREAIKIKLGETIPSGGIVYINGTNIKGVFDDYVFGSNFLGKFIKQSSKLITEINKNKKRGKSKKKKTAPFNLNVGMENPDVGKLFGYNFSLSLYNSDEKKRPELLLSVALKNPTYFDQMLDSAETLLTQVAKETCTNENEPCFMRKKETYKDNEIEYLMFSSNQVKERVNLYFLVINSVGHVSTDIELLKKIIDISKGDTGDTIASSAAYREIKDRQNGSIFLSTFIDFTVLTSIKEYEIIDEPDYSFTKELKKIVNTIKKMKNAKCLYAGISIDKGLSTDAEFVLDESNKEFIKRLEEKHIAPGKDVFRDLVKNPPIMYLSYGASAKEYFDDLYKEDLKKKKGYFQNIFRSLTSPSLNDEALSHLEDGVAYVFSGIDLKASPLMPLPKVFVAFKIKDQDKFSAVYDKINESLKDPKRGINLVTEEYNGHKFSFVMVPPGIFPGHAMLSDYYILFSTPSAFKDVVDGFKSKGTPYFDQEEQVKLIEHVNSDYHYFTYLDSKLLLEQMPVIFNKYSSVYIGQEKVRKSINDNLIPLFKTLTAFERGVASGYYDKDKKRILFKSHYTFKDIVIDPNDPEEIIDRGIGLAKKEKFDEAIIEFDKAIKINPKDTEARYYRGSALIDKGLYSEAVIEFKKALEIEPKNPKLHYNLGIALAENGQLDEGITACKKAIEIKPDIALGHLDLGRMLRRKDKINDAIIEFKKAIEIEPRYVYAHLELGYALGDKGQLDEATKSFNKAYEIEPDNPDVLNEIGYYYAEKGINLDIAEEYLVKANKLETDNAAIMDSLGLLYYKKGDMQKALKFLDDANASVPGDPEMMEHLADVYYALGDNEKALALYEKVLEKSPGKKDELTNKINELKQTE